MKPIARTNTSKFYDTKSYIIQKDKDGIIHRNIKEDAHIEVDELKETEKLITSLNRGKKNLTLIDARNHHTMTPEATEFLKKAHSLRKATAIISSNLSQKILVGFLSKNPDSNPLKIFPTENEAIKWLLAFKRKY